MARRSESFESLTVVQREELEADILRWDLTWRELAKKFGVPEATLRAFADRKGLVRNATGLKRELVAQILAKPDMEPAATDSAQSAQQTAQRAESPPKTAREEIEAAAKEDARDMRNGLIAARIALNVVGKKLMEVAQKPHVFEAREVKILAETVSIAIRTIREIQGLDPKEAVGKPMTVVIRREELPHGDGF